MRKMFLCLAAVAALTLQGFGYAKGATESWVKKYIENNYVASGTLVAKASPVVLSATPVVSAEMPLDDTNMVAQFTFTMNTNSALVVSDTYVGGITNGTKWAWDDAEQKYYNRGFADMPAIEHHYELVNRTSASGNSYVESVELFTATNSLGNWFTYFDDDGTWLMLNTDSSKRFRITATTISDAERDALVKAQIVALFYNHYLGEWFEMYTCAVSSSGGASGNGSGTLTLTITYKGKVYKLASFSHPQTMKACDYVDPSGNPCTNQKYDYDGWYDYTKWGITFPISGKADDGSSFNFYERNFKANSNWSDYVADIIQQEEQAHIHNCEPPHTHEHEHIRGANCVCSWECADKTCNYKCGTQLEHLTGDAIYAYADNSQCAGYSNPCQRKCANPDCSLYSEFEKHTEVHSCIRFPTLTDGEGNQYYSQHACGCGYNHSGHAKYIKSQEEVADPDDSTKTIIKSVCVCADGSGNVSDKYQYCGQEWVEVSQGHTHAYSLDESGGEVCKLKITKDGEKVDCGVTRAHDYSMAINGSEQCFQCANSLAGGTTCGSHRDEYDSCAKHSAMYTAEGDEDKHWGACTAQHSCDCGEKKSAHLNVDTGAGEFEKDGKKWLAVYCPTAEGGCGHYWFECKGDHTHEYELDDGDNEICLVEYTDENGNKQTCNSTRAHDYKTWGGSTCVPCPNEMPNEMKGYTTCGVIKHSYMISLDDDQKTATKGHCCNCYKNGDTEKGIKGAHAKLEKGEPYETEPDAEGKTELKQDYICAASESGTADATHCGYEWTETSTGHNHAYELSADGVETCTILIKNRQGESSACGHTNPHKYGTFEGGGECMKCTNTLKDGTKCGDSSLSPMKHGGLWQEYEENATNPDGITDTSGYHHCDCGFSYEAHGRTNEKTSNYVVTNGLDIITYNVTEYDCPQPTAGCGKHFAITNNTSIKVNGLNHGCTISPYKDQTDGCVEANMRDSTCHCKLHSVHQLDHIAETNSVSNCKRCVYCHKPMDGSQYHGSPWHNCDTDTSGWEDMSASKGHSCDCGTITNAHSIVTGLGLKTIDGQLKNVTKYTCSLCSFNWLGNNTNECAHGYYEIEDGKAGTLHEMWKDCVCQWCSTNRAHSLTRTIAAEEGMCEKTGCSNKNGYDWDYSTCSFVTNSVKGKHIYGSANDDEKTHSCFCGAITNAPHSVTNSVGDYACVTEKRCKPSPDGCNFLMGATHSNVSNKLEVCGSAKRRVCTICGREYSGYEDSPTQESLTDDENWAAAGTNPFNHEWLTNDAGETISCYCLCGAVTNHIDNITGLRCGCECNTETDSFHHYPPSGTNACYCISHHSNPQHQTPYNSAKEDVTTNSCSICGLDYESWNIVKRCPRCKEVISKTPQGGTHTCDGDTDVSAGTYHLSWTEYYDSDGELVEAGEEDGTFSGSGFSGMNAWAASSTLSASGGSISVTETDVYYLYTKIDDSGSVSVGSLSGSGGGHWTKWGKGGHGTLYAGKSYPVSASCSSGESIIGFAIQLVPEGQVGPDGSKAEGD